MVPGTPDFCPLALDRIQRWGRAIGEAGRREISLDELLRLQAMVIGDPTNTGPYLAVASQVLPYP